VRLICMSNFASKASRSVIVHARSSREPPVRTLERRQLQPSVLPRRRDHHPAGRGGRSAVHRGRALGIDRHSRLHGRPTSRRQRPRVVCPGVHPASPHSPATARRATWASGHRSAAVSVPPAICVALPAAFGQLFIGDIRDAKYFFKDRLPGVAWPNYTPSVPNRLEKCSVGQGWPSFKSETYEVGGGFFGERLASRSRRTAGGWQRSLYRCRFGEQSHCAVSTLLYTVPDDY